MAVAVWAINVALTQIVALGANLLVCFRRLAPLPEGELRDMAPKLLRYQALPSIRPADPRTAETVAPPPCGRSRVDDLLHAWRAVKALPAPTLTTITCPTIMEGLHPDAWNPAPPTRQSDPDPAHALETMIKIKAATKGTSRHPGEKLGIATAAVRLQAPAVPQEVYSTN